MDRASSFCGGWRIVAGRRLASGRSLRALGGRSNVGRSSRSCAPYRVRLRAARFCPLGCSDPLAPTLADQRRNPRVDDRRRGTDDARSDDPCKSRSHWTDASRVHSDPADLFVRAPCRSFAHHRCFRAIECAPLRGRRGMVHGVRWFCCPVRTVIDRSPTGLA